MGLAARYGMSLAEADDMVTAVKAMVGSGQQPLLHYWDTHPQARSWSAEQIADLHVAVADVLRPAFAAVIADHVESGTPVVMEGDYLLPELATAHAGAVRAVVLTEPEQPQLMANYRSREPDHGEQRHRARVSVLIGARLAGRAHQHGIAVVPARPWADQLDRIDAALRAA